MGDGICHEPLRTNAWRRLCAAWISSGKQDMIPKVDLQTKVRDGRFTNAKRHLTHRLHRKKKSWKDLFHNKIVEEEKRMMIG